VCIIITDDAIPGYVEVYLVGHCGETTAGDYINTLDKVLILHMIPFYILPDDIGRREG
jgi:hypothetical protein